LVDFTVSILHKEFLIINRNIESHGYIAMPGKRGLCGDRCGGRGECIIGQTGYEPVKDAIKEIWDLRDGIITVKNPQIGISLVGCFYDLPIFEFEIENLGCYADVTWSGVGNPFQPALAGNYTISATVFNTQNPQVQNTVSLNFNVDEEVFLMCLDGEEGDRKANQITPSEAQLSIYPNPAKDQLYVSVRSASIPQSYRIIDNQGQVVKTGKSKGERWMIKLDKLAAGMYLIEIQLQNGEQHRKKVIIE
ncbi:MAG: T9SS type A sorting domain-containing protein, partial [Bacteroidota bacterium]